MHKRIAPNGICGNPPSETVICANHKASSAYLCPSVEICGQIQVGAKHILQSLYASGMKLEGQTEPPHQ